MRTLSTLAFLFSLTYLTAKAQPLGPVTRNLDLRPELALGRHSRQLLPPAHQFERRRL